MKHIPMLFSGPMALANIEGRKTQTRRIIQGAPNSDSMLGWKVNGLRMISPTGCVSMAIKHRYGQLGDVIWQKETFRKYFHVDEHGYTKFDDQRIEYAADRPEPIYQKDGDGFQVFNKNGTEKMIPWHSGRFMPKTAARFFGEITDIRIERVADISEVDAIAEGISGNSHAGWGDNECGSAVLAYRSLWNSINGTPSPVLEKGKTVGYICYPFDEDSVKEVKGIYYTSLLEPSPFFRGLPLTVIPNPFIFAITYKSIPKPPTFLLC